MFARLISLGLVGCVAILVGVGCSGEEGPGSETAEPEANSARECNPLTARTTSNTGNITGLASMGSTPMPSLGPDSGGYFYPPTGYTEGGTFATASDGTNNVWRVEAREIAAAAPAGKLRVGEWNIARGNKLDKIIKTMKKINADVWLLNETDLYGKNSGNVVVAREIARGLGYSYYTGIEFYERRDDRRGTSGNAIVSRLPLASTRSVEIPILASEGGHDWSTSGSEPRCGQRSAMSATIEAPTSTGGTRSVDIVSLHTENKSNAKVRLKQFDHVVQKLVTPNRPTIVAGDLNTVSAGEGGSFRRELADRNARAGRAKSLFDCSRGDDSPTFGAALVVNLRIDWMMVQSGEGDSVDCPAGAYDVKSAEGASDHKPVVVEMTVK